MRIYLFKYVYAIVEILIRYENIPYEQSSVLDSMTFRYFSVLDFNQISYSII